jgi:hypothetical protein
MWYLGRELFLWRRETIEQQSYNDGTLSSGDNNNVIERAATTINTI